MNIKFKPTRTIEQLLQGSTKTNKPVKVAGRLYNVADNHLLTLKDGYMSLQVEIANPTSTIPLQYAWLGIEGYWNPKTDILQKATIEYILEPKIQIEEAEKQSLPETPFIKEPQKLKSFYLRSKLIKWIRHFFEERGFLEVQTPFLHEVAEIGYLHQYQTQSLKGRTMYLRTDPEEYLKRYLTCGLEAVFEISTNIRGEIADDYHLQEFTSVECYKRFWSFEEAIETTTELVWSVLDTFLGKRKVVIKNKNIDISSSIDVFTFHELILRYTGIDVMQYSTAQALGTYMREKGLWEGTNTPLDDYRRTWLEWLLDNKVLPYFEKPIYLIDYPIDIGLSYKEKPDQAGICLRGELFLPGGLELAHMYENITDPVILEKRYQHRLEHRMAAGLSKVEIDVGLHKSMALGMPPVGGIALGIDRLFLLISESDSIGEGLLFPREGCD